MEEKMLPNIGEMIVSRPDGEVYIAGTGVPVRQIWDWYQRGDPPCEIADKQGGIGLAQVHAALAYTAGRLGAPSERSDSDIGALIDSKPGVLSGRPKLAGTRISVMRIAGWYQQELIPEEIVDNYGHITLAQVHAALAYYYANKEEIDAALQEEYESYERLRQQHRHAHPA